MKRSTETILRIYLCCFVLAALLLIPSTNVWNSMTGLVTASAPASASIFIVGMLSIVLVVWGYVRIHRR